MDFGEHAKSIIAQLDARGMERPDSAVAVHLSWAIAGLEHLLFTDKRAPVILADYLHERNSVEYEYEANGIGHYTLYVPGIRRQLRLECLTTWLDNTHLPTPRTPPVPTMLEAIMGLAVHEVRHRVQFNCSSLRRWMPDTHTEGIMGVMLERVRASGRWRLAAPTTPNLPAPYEELEFDAQVIQLHALHRMDALETPDELAQIVLLEP